MIESLDKFSPGINTLRGIACLRKKQFSTRGDATQRGMKVYQCPHCGYFHQAKDKTFIEQRVIEKRLNRQEQERNHQAAIARKKPRKKKKASARWSKAELRAFRFGQISQSKTPMAVK